MDVGFWISDLIQRTEAPEFGIGNAECGKEKKDRRQRTEDRGQKADVR